MYLNDTEMRPGKTAQAARRPRRPYGRRHCSRATIECTSPTARAAVGAQRRVEMREELYARARNLCNALIEAGEELRPSHVEAVRTKRRERRRKGARAAARHSGGNDAAKGAKGPRSSHHGQVGAGGGGSAGNGRNYGASGGRKRGSAARRRSRSRSGGRTAGRSVARTTPGSELAFVVARGEAVSFDTLSSVFRQQHQAFIRRTSFTHRSAIGDYAARWEAGEAIADIAADVRYSPYMLMRLLIEHIYKVPKSRVGKLIKAPAEIPDKRMREEVSYCVEIDTLCSPFVDRARHAIGEEYEAVLQQTLRNRGIPFETEDELRQRGMHKTPDVKLLVPIAVAGPSGEQRVVNWIDSKAMFGDRYTHETKNKAQLLGYVNRYGPGLVIYWFDFVDSLNQHADVLLASRFPDSHWLPGESHPAPPLDLHALASAKRRQSKEETTLSTNVLPPRAGGKRAGAADAADTWLSVTL